MAVPNRFGHSTAGGRIEPAPFFTRAEIQARWRDGKAEETAPPASECTHGHPLNRLTRLGSVCRVCLYEYMAGEGSERHRVKLDALRSRLAAMEVTE